MQSLSYDQEFHSSGLQTLTSLKHSLRTTINHRRHTIEQLRELKKEVEESYDKSKKATIGGTVATVTGSALSIAGVTTGFFTFGAGFIVAGVGAAIAAAGSATIGGAQLGYHYVSNKVLNDVQQAVEKDRANATDTEQNGNRFNSILENLARKHRISKETVYVQIKYYYNYRSLANNTAGLIYSIGQHCVALGGAASRLGGGATSVRSVVTAAQAAAAGTRLTVAGLKTISGILTIGGVALNVIFIPMEVYTMAQASKEVHKYRTTGESGSEAAKKIQNIIRALEDNLREMRSVLTELESIPPEEKRPASVNRNREVQHNTRIQVLFLIFCCCRKFNDEERNSLLN